MTELAKELARLGLKIHYVSEETLSKERRDMGWATGDLAGVQLHLVTSSSEARNLVDQFPEEAVHITQGVRSNGLIQYAQRRIMELERRHYPIMEKVDLRGFKGRLKPLVYAFRFFVMGRGIEGLLAIGEGTPDWIARRAPKKMRIFPFTYFLRGRISRLERGDAPELRFIYVGGLVQRKRVDLLIEALSGLKHRKFKLEIIGDGPERVRLEKQASEALEGLVTFLGTVEMANAIERIAASDCLILPSDHDGWGAVVSEAQINGTPTICSSECGAAGSVRSNGFGRVFTAGDVDDLSSALKWVLDQGLITAGNRDRLSEWARTLTAEAGAHYLMKILNHEGEAGMISPPWEENLS
jgi:glycosyltransferase involved in cell wall biosynthesis